MPEEYSQCDIDTWRFCARGCQDWETIDVSVAEHRASLVIDDGFNIALTRIQTEEFSKWLAAKMTA